MESIPSKQWSDNVEQLIRETDEAFKAVDFAITDAKEAIRDWNVKDHNTSVTRDTAKSVARKQIKVPITRHASVSKPKRKKSSKAKAKSSKNRKLRHSKSLQAARIHSLAQIFGLLCMSISLPLRSAFCPQNQKQPHLSERKKSFSQFKRFLPLYLRRSSRV